MKHRDRQVGFTLVEMLIYIAIFLLVSTASVTFLISLDDFIQEYQVETALYRSSTSVLEQVQLALRQGESLDVFNSTLGTTTGALAVVAGATTTRFAKVGNDLELSVNSEVIGGLLTDEVVVTDFTVYQYPLAIGEAVRVRLSLSATVGSTTKTKTFYTGSVMSDSI